MPCDSSYLDASRLERELSRVYQLLDELDGKRKRPNRESWRGYDERAYGKADRETLDRKVAELCARLRVKRPDEIRTHSLELQVWWRDHQAADAEREHVSRSETKRRKLVQRALDKLTAEELRALELMRSRDN